MGVDSAFERYVMSCSSVAAPGLAKLGLTTLLAAMSLLCMPAAAVEGCDLHWQITPQLEASPRHLAVTMSFDAGKRTRTELSLPPPWAGVEDYAEHITGLRSAQPQHSIEPVSGKPLKRVIHHRAGETVQLQYQITTPILDADAATPRPHRDSYRTQLGARWFQFFGHAALPRIEGVGEVPTTRLCMDFDGQPETSTWIHSHGVQRGSAARIRLKGNAEQIHNAVYLGGDLQLRERRIEGRPVWTVMPPQTPPSPFAPGIDVIADRIAQLIAAQRKFWRGADAATDFSHQVVVLHPNHQPRGSAGGTAVHQAFVMHSANDLAVPGEAFDHLVTHEHLHTWMPQRLGPMAYTGRDDEALRYWFSEGFTDALTHRLLLQTGLWTLDDVARTLNRKIDRYRQSPALRTDNARVAQAFFSDQAIGELPYARGEWLALRWHAALLAQGHPGLDAVLRRLALPAAQARPDGPLSKPLATHRLVAALRPLLGEQPLADIAAHIDKGQPFEFGDATLGPCFTLQRTQQPVWQLGFDVESLRQRVIAGVDVAGPAHAAGLRDGMAVRGMSIAHGDVNQDVLVQVDTGDGSVRDIRYRPIGATSREVLSYRAVADGLQQSACRAWVGGDVEAEDRAAAAWLGRAVAVPGKASSAKIKAKSKSGKKTVSKVKGRTRPR